jgi:membrane fusion protein (multidrug efflux system)
MSMEEIRLFTRCSLPIKAWFCLALSLFLTGCNSAPAPVSQPELPVTTMFVEAKDHPITFTYIAQTQSSHLVNIQARVSGFLDKQVYKEGDYVKEGDILFIMDKSPFIAQVEAAKAALQRQKAAHETATLNLKRVRPLAEQNALSQKDLDDAVGAFQSTAAAVAQAQAQLETAELNLSYCTIRSPLDGITSSALQQEGSYLNVTDSQLTTVSALDPIWVNFSLSENQMQSYRDQVKKGHLILPKSQEFVIKVVLVNGEIFPYSGSITFTEPYYNAQTGTFLVRATLANPEGVLRPNQYVRVLVEGAIRPQTILVPQKAVQQSGKGHFLWVINSEGKAEIRPVVVGDWEGENWFITEGLSPKEQVVVDGGISLSPGAKVKITKVLTAE